MTTQDRFTLALHATWSVLRMKNTYSFFSVFVYMGVRRGVNYPLTMV